MLTHIPVPTWRELARALTRRPLSDADLAAPWRRTDDTAGWLSRSAWSLALVAHWRARQGDASPVCVWIPDYFCNSALAVLRRTGALIVFYPLGNGHTPDMAVCRTLAEATPPHVVVLVHYFGEPTPSAPMRDFCARNGAWLVEDAAHALRPSQGIGSHGDFVLYSPHKHLAIPDGAVLVARTRGASKMDAQRIAAFGVPGEWAAQAQSLAHFAGMRAGSSGAAIWLAKRLVQKLGLRRWTRGEAQFAEPATAPGPDPADPPEMSNCSRRLLGLMIDGLPKIARHRQRNQLLWDAAITSGKRDDTVSLASRPAHRAWTPYLASYVVNPDTASATFAAWQRCGLPATTWPDMPPEVAAHRDRHAVAWQLRHGRIFLPVHQSMNAADVQRRRSVPREAAVADSRIVARWNSASRAEWAWWIQQAGRSNLLQAWAYGEAKAATSGWKLNRVAYYKGDAPIAIVQVLERRVGRVLRAYRVNRGPLPLRLLDVSEQLGLWRELRCLGSWMQRRVLSIAPEIALSGESLGLMRRLGLRQRLPLAWESVWIDLSAGSEAVRKGLDSKWRNMLVSGEKAGLVAEIGSDDQLLVWMLSRYRELMREKNFEGIPVNVLEELCTNQADDLELLVLRAMHDGEPVAGICVACHGATATYLLGWSGPAGRSLKANQFLLWQAVVRLHEGGRRWFDLGGINEDATPGISAFKLGMNGERYELVGEFLKW